MCLFLWYRKFCYSARVSLLFAMNRVVLRIQIIEMQSCFFQWWTITTNKEWWIFLCHLPFSNLLSPSTVLTGETVFVRKNRRSKHIIILINSQNSTYWLHKFQMCHNICLYKWVNRNTFTCSLESRAVAHLAFSVLIQIWVISFWFNFIDLNSL